ncbi:MAG: glycoside hydrolase family 15 protein [Lewinella sp.]
MVPKIGYKQEHGATDGLEGEEASFTICSFWYAECLARTGRVEEATLVMQKLLGYGNHLGLFSEEIGIHGEQLGNFPQAFSHLSLISAAFQIDKQL